MPIRIVCRMLSARQLHALRSSPLELNRLQVAMDLLKLTQLQLEDATGIPQPTISRIASGTQLPQIPTAHKLAGYFGCQIEDLFPARDGVSA